MELDLDAPELAGRAYGILASLVTPRPIALVTTFDGQERINVAPFSFFNLMGAWPPICVFAPGDRGDGTPKDTALNVRTSQEFVVNLVDEAMAEAMNLCATSLPFGQSELELCGLHVAPCSVVRPPRITEAPASLECKAWGTLEVGLNRLVIGLIVRVHLRDELFDAAGQRVISEKLHTIGRMASPHWYCRTDDRFEMIRPD
ncbi:flavin reductase family protein [Synechococcus sp. CCY 9618]|uniref:flavin reductase family protein n=1 Tax=Synechococcus sp. CCY 9618 TaxID=2815602 RepID=UPI001C23FDA1|nr:flavin reductase family protein [Synechococcus sp. CCY 9618]